MKIQLDKLKEGDFVYCTGDSGFCTDSTEKVTKVSIQYDSKTGKPFNVIYLSGGRKFDSRHGGAMNSPTAYYLVPTDQEKAKVEQDKKDKEEAERNARYKERENQKKAILKKLTPKERQILGF